jgi:hypothetical protein
MSAASGKANASTTDKDIWFGVILQGATAQNYLATVLLTGINSLSI